MSWGSGENNIAQVSNWQIASENTFFHRSRLDVKDDDGEIYYITLEKLEIFDPSNETLKISDEWGDKEDYVSVWIRPRLNCFESDSEELVNIVKKDFLQPWNGEDYNFSVPVDQLDTTSLQGEVGQPKEVDDLIYGGKVKDGFFIEAGAFDFETHSDSLYFELTHNWTGLLVEAHPLAFNKGLKKNRKVTSVMTCLSTSGKVETSYFDLTGSVRSGGERESMSGLVRSPTDKSVKMQCLPLYTLLLALGNPTVHYFSLDIEGAEFPVLKTIPWDKVKGVT